MKSFYTEAKNHLSNCTRIISVSDETTTPAAHQNYKHELEHEHEYEYDCDTDITSTEATMSPHAEHYDNGMQRLSSSTPSGLGMNNNFITSTTTYDTLQRPFKPDKLRGRWSTAADFYFACISHAFGSVIFSELALYVSVCAGAWALLPYLCGILLYAIPIFGIQTFLGQFSTSGTISVFRVAPIFKGIGYSILLHNLVSLSYYAVIASVPLVYAVNSLYTVIPWMSCNNSWNTPNCSTHNTYDDYDEVEIYPHASEEYFRYIIRSEESSDHPLTISWPILGGIIAVWLLTLAIILKRVTFIGKFLRCTSLLLITLFIAIFVHLLMYVQISWETIVEDYMEPILPDRREVLMAGIKAAVIMPMWLLGPGCGSILTLASHNRFRQDTEKQMYWVAITFMIITQMGTLCTRIALDHFEDHVALLHFHVNEEHNMRFIYICFAYLFSSFNSLPNFWSFLFFFMLFLAELSAVIVQMMTVLRALFDEFETLRKIKSKFTIGLTMLMLPVSIYFCTKQGFQHLHVLPDAALVTHLSISIFLLFVSTWIYGRERFQCDLQFMLGKTISNFKIFLLRFLTPFFLGFCIGDVIYSTYTDDEENPPCLIIVIIQCLVFVAVPLYIVYKISRSRGSLRQRVKQCFSPHDWHPVDADNRRFYEEIMGTSEMLVILSNEHETC
ncbi:sodium-dependent noradrenaline transporter [Stomoxys calcitrans]|uniref:Amino acid transporter transmembrane domain-containing protein n=1 Tax=Stomoxys calcitrans TaxID=35570 RepID=A0A1I8PR53_STOCA|nr:sodium-dependent noradrenaline transporter [Stomoxys calcitrans]XP_013104386.1 sodium-dependent noradrenaline transporter [Stomoxys calcitrans]XP_013104388.1 sodium-dependent noradrenaline transporter [Stomoxys calcitrans]XP_059220186.1 sodium-dependent noradrenaline transporter [Stomoxys calcitrans]XP_059220188.1 sodium-dependent noradrenaline transporter [Stomoxys calcitrans]XP_059220189.1 sodium-dependent noradrenaline transporter [Stomoxys calcitrans]XP_059220190.1 sodium-dependent nor